MNICETTFFITALANIITSSLTEEETAYLAALLVQLGDTLATILAQEGLKNDSLPEENIFS